MNTPNVSHMLHVIGGDSAAGSLKVAFRLSREQLLVSEDPLTCGPAPATNDLDDWRAIRETFIRSLYPDWPDFSFDAYADYGLLMNASRLGRDTPVIVWIAPGLPDQLLLAWVVFLYDLLDLDISGLRVGQFEILADNWRVRSMGELSPENIQKYCPDPRALNVDEIDALREAWKVYTVITPLLTDARSRIHAAASMCFGGNPPLALLGRS